MKGLGKGERFHFQPVLLVFVIVSSQTLHNLMQYGDHASLRKRAFAKRLAQQIRHT
jgi:hypothetical protein